MVTDKDRFEQVVLTRPDNNAPRGASGTLMDVFPHFVIVEGLAGEDGAPAIWVVARDAVTRAPGSAAA